MEKTLIQRSGTTVYSINFDFTSSQQKRVLQDLQANGYKLMGYKGAKGSNQITSGVPAWFVINFSNMFGTEEIYYEQEYKVYAFNKSVIDSNTTIQMQALSQEIPLGTVLNFHQDGTFSIGGKAPEGEIIVKNGRPAGSPNIIIGLAAKVNRRFAPFCAFTSVSQGDVSMKPNENIAVFASQVDINQGNVTSNAMASGCSFVFSAQDINYDLQIIQRTYDITQAPGATFVNNIPAGQSLIQLLNK